MSPTSPLATRLHNQMILAPLTRGGNLPYRRLCADFGCDASFSEMTYARNLLKNEGIELARMRRAPGETTFGVQIATNEIEEGVAAAKMAAASGADWVDLNCGCPIYEATRRGLGAALLRKPHKLEQLVAGIAAGSSLPLSVKVRTGEFRNALNVRDVASRLRCCGLAPDDSAIVGLALCVRGMDASVTCRVCHVKHPAANLVALKATYENEGCI